MSSENYSYWSNHLPAKQGSGGSSDFSRRIAHLDMDAFYGSVELLRYPQLKGLPVVIGGSRRSVDEVFLQLIQDRDLASIQPSEFPLLGNYKGRGVITTATYPARQFGVGSAMGLMKAAVLCPQAILLPVDFPRYKHYSKLFKEQILKFTPLMEDRGVDEVYIDFTDIENGQSNGGYDLAVQLQTAILKATGLTCSIGVAPNKLLAKMASEFNKPKGISIVVEQDLENKIWPLECRKINGIGPKTDQKLKTLGISTIGQLAEQNQFDLMKIFGKSYGAWLYDSAWGKDNRRVVTSTEPSSISRETTFDKDLSVHLHKLELGQTLNQLCQQVSEDLQRKGYAAKTIGVKLRFADFKVVTRDQSSATYLFQAQDLRKLCGQALKRVDLSRRIRLLGVRAAGLITLKELQQNQQNNSNFKVAEQFNLDW
jgi:DNA polymerase-4